ncbi:hypothetical protein BST61_g6752 [Cercospora zeina]
MLLHISFIDAKQLPDSATTTTTPPQLNMNFINRAAARCFAVLFVSADLGCRAEKAIVPKVNKMLQEKKTEKKEKEKMKKSEMLERAFYEMMI